MFIELINITDLNDIEKCGSVSLPIYYTEFDLNILLYDKKFVIYKAIINNKLCGFLIGRIDDKLIHIMSLAVYPEYRRLKVGSNLINKIKDIYNDKHITLNVQQTNKNAISFYLKNNFVYIEELINYYPNLECKNAYHMCYKNENTDY